MEAKEVHQERRNGARLASVVIAVTLQRLLSNWEGQRSAEEELVLDALRRSKTDLHDATDAELAKYLQGMEPESLAGVVSNVKGIYHELLFQRVENSDGDAVFAEIKEATNHPGADVEFWIDGEVIDEVQLKAVASPASIQTHFERYPDIPVYATSEVASIMPGIHNSGFSNQELQTAVREQLESLDSNTHSDELVEGLATSSIVTSAFLARDALAGKPVDQESLNTAIASIAAGVTVASFMSVLLAA